MGKKMTKAGMVLRRAIRADIDAEPGIDHKKIRSKYTVGEQIVESAMTKTLAEWDAIIAATPDDAPRAEVKPQEKHPEPLTSTPPETREAIIKPASFTMPGIEQGFVKFARKPAKMGDDYIFWIPRVYLKNGLVDPRSEYEVYLKKK